MNFEVGDIVCLSNDSFFYKVLKTRKGFPCEICNVKNKNGDALNNSGTVHKDLSNEWHTYTWKLVRKNNPIILSKHDKKYEKIILKMKQLDYKFKERKAA